MRSLVEHARNKIMHRVRLSAAAAILYSVGLLAIPQPTVAQDDAQPSEAEIHRALDTLKQDPNLALERKMRSLKWASKSERAKQTDVSGLGWLTNLFASLFDWLAQGTRLLLWTLVIILAAILVVFLIRIIRKIEAPFKPLQATLPTHVRELDIRPESLPDDVGAAAWQLWERGEQRAALSLLYRGLLSCLVHRHAVPILHSSTEADCLELARSRLSATRLSYVSRLLTIWQRAVYGGRNPTDDELQQLCQEFNQLLQPSIVDAVEHAA